jgi:bifunctional ADP-heptose synthase (sugar kinase/adenylyltransferase)
MNGSRFREIAARYGQLRLAVVGDFCLDRYLEIDPTRAETSIETGLPVHNVTRVRAQPGAAGTVLNNLAALGVGQIDLVGFCGQDGEGYELKHALSALPGVCMDHFVTTPDRRTFTYCKPLVLEPEGAPRELNRLDSKNWTSTPPHIVKQLVASLQTLASQVDAIIVMDQVDVAETGVVTSGVLEALGSVPNTIPVIADSRRGLTAYPPVIFKMNAVELAVMTEQPELRQIDEIREAALRLAGRNR